MLCRHIISMYKQIYTEQYWIRISRFMDNPWDSIQYFYIYWTSYLVDPFQYSNHWTYSVQYNISFNNESLGFRSNILTLKNKNTRTKDIHISVKMSIKNKQKKIIDSMKFWLNIQNSCNKIILLTKEKQIRSQTVYK